MLKKWDILKKSEKELIKILQMKKKVLVAMSGGVDSSFSFVHLNNNGYDCVGVHLILNECANIAAKIDLINDAIKKITNSNLITLNFVDDFKLNVIDNFIKFYELGLTPNPCVWCNKFFKFGKLLNYALENNFDYLATGHYAQIYFSESKNRFILKKAIDISKDQTYFLFFLRQDQLAKIKLPLGDFTKLEVKTLAQNIGLKSAYQPESQDICFVGNQHYVNFIKNITKKNYVSGNFVDETGKVLGKHSGILNYTVGQRKGLKLSLNKPMFVEKINVATNEIVLSPKHGLLTNQINLHNVSVTSNQFPTKPINVKVKLRYSSAEYKATVKFLSFDKAVVILEEEQTKPAIGQFVVFYNDDEVVGGGEVV